MQWVDAYIADAFTVDMSTTQKSEGVNNHFKIYLTPTTSLHSLLEITQKVHEKKLYKMREIDLQNINYTLILRTSTFIEAQVLKIYTHKMMKFFGKEVADSTNYKIEAIEDNNTIATCKVTKPGSRTRVFVVEFKNHNQIASCTCHLYDKLGSLCKHVLGIFSVDNIFEILSHFIMNRWKKDVLKGAVVDERENASESVELYELIMSDFPATCAKGDANIASIVDSSDVNKNPSSSIRNEGCPLQNILEPPLARTKGRPCCTRYKSRSEVESEEAKAKENDGIRKCAEVEMEVLYCLTFLLSIIHNNLQYAALSALRRLPLDPGNPTFLHRAIQGLTFLASGSGVSMTRIAASLNLVINREGDSPDFCLVERVALRTEPEECVELDVLVVSL
ncbi:protein FAR1-RELATED SEQUENCE 2-like [Amborella trichopoda]|uniref:protein FAR1-RELATED SEQUENCE 2-like n=1 Tax=Amborella trichopoda TaxID=13333 RepID=UPI0005D435C7|nr:protein FAR1-RELATED SEQUENCE 2-like [Amborella trichopoda]|eukprot:XP_011629154.1 protein FAR1-RELATED SEQUENCE 2-like [Amborella trichopoda]